MLKYYVTQITKQINIKESNQLIQSLYLNGDLSWTPMLQDIIKKWFICKQHLLLKVFS